VALKLRVEFVFWVPRDLLLRVFGALFGLIFPLKNDDATSSIPNCDEIAGIIELYGGEDID